MSKTDVTRGATNIREIIIVKMFSNSVHGSSDDISRKNPAYNPRKKTIVILYRFRRGSPQPVGVDVG